MKYLIFILIFSILTLSYSIELNETQAFIIYNKANEQYRNKNFEEAKKYYLELMSNYPKSKYVPDSLFILSHIENDFTSIIKYLNIIKNEYPDFRYWTNSIEKLAEIYYIIGNYKDAIIEYNRISTDKSYFMLGFIYAANNFENLAIENINKLLKITKDKDLIYKSYLILLKIYIDNKNYEDAGKILRKAVKYKNWAYDNGARLLYYAGKYYFLRNDILSNYQKSYYIFSLLKTQFPLSIESTMANNYFAFFTKNNINNYEILPWIRDEFEKPVELAFKDDKVTLVEELENKAEKISIESEQLSGNFVRSQVLEYVIRVGKYKDISIANLVITDLNKAGFKNMFGIYLKDGYFVPEMRGITDLETAKSIGEKIINLGYTDTKVIEIVKLIQYRD